MCFNLFINLINEEKKALCILFFSFSFGADIQEPNGAFWDFLISRGFTLFTTHRVFFFFNFPTSQYKEL